MRWKAFKGAATRANCGVGPLRDFYVALLDKGMKPEMARLTLARKIAAHCSDTLEEGGTFRRRTTEAASSLSVTQNSGDPRFQASVVVHRFCDARVRGRVSIRSLGAVCCAAAKGFEPEGALRGEGLGLTSMRERARLVNGTISINSKLMAGTTIHFRAPLESALVLPREAGD
jgi:hypothetical protein